MSGARHLLIHSVKSAGQITRYLIVMHANTPEPREDEHINYSDIPELSDDAVLVWSGPIQSYLEFLRTQRDTER